MLTGQILLQFIVILLVVQVFGVLCRRIGQQWVIGEILAGLALGPSLLGALWPSLQAAIFPVNVLPTLQTLGDIGLILYMFSLGARLDTNVMLGQSRKALVASLSGILLPMILGSALAFFLYPDQAGPRATLASFALLMGTSISVTAFPVLARFLTEKQLIGTPIGTLALTCAAVGDVVAWCLLALVVAVIHSSGVASVLLTLGTVILFVMVMFIGVRPFLFQVEHHLRSPQALIVLTMMLLLGSAFITNVVGIHPIFGAFVMGIILPRRAVYINFIRHIDKINDVLFLPLFFVYSGLRTQIGLISSPNLWLVCLIILLIACAGKIVGGTLSVRWMGDSWKSSLTLGILMNTRGLVELIVLNIGLDLGILSPGLFAMLVLMALITTMMASPLLSLLGYRQPQQSSEQSNDLASTEISFGSHTDIS